MNRLQNMVINATNGVSMDGHQLRLYTVDDSGQSKVIYVGTRTVNGKPSIVTSSSYVDYDPTTGDPYYTGHGDPEEVIATYVTGMVADVSKVKTEGLITITLTMENKDKTYTATSSYHLRNRVSKEITNDLNDHFKVN